MNNYYYCYNTVKKNYLLENGINYIDKDIHKRTGNTFWVFVRNSKLDELLSNWRNVQNKRFND